MLVTRIPKKGAHHDDDGCCCCCCCCCCSHINLSPQYNAAVRGRRGGSNNFGVCGRNTSVKQYNNKQKVVHTITEEHLYTSQIHEKRRSARVRIRCMRYAVQVATETGKTTYYPETIGLMKKHNSTLKNRNQKSKKTHTSKRQERGKSSSQARKQ